MQKSKCKGLRRCKQAILECSDLCQCTVEICINRSEDKVEEAEEVSESYLESETDCDEEL